MSNPNELQFDSAAGLGFGNDLADGLLDFMPQAEFNPDLPQFDYGDLQAAAPLPVKSSEEIAAYVEDVLLSMLENEQRTDLLILCGEQPDVGNSLNEDDKQEFSEMYNEACLYNPAIRWYAKLAKILPPEAFSVSSEQITMTIPQDTFNKVLRPFLSDFDPQFSQESPLVAVVQQVADQLGADALAAKQADLARGGKTQHGKEASDLNLDTVDFGEAPEKTPIAARLEALKQRRQGDVDIIDDMFGNPSAQEAAQIDISMVDLSNKAVAEYLDNQQATTDSIAERLLNEGFSKQRANEIAGIVKYMRLDRSLKRGQAVGNLGGDTDLIPIKF